MICQVYNELNLMQTKKLSFHSISYAKYIHKGTSSSYCVLLAFGLAENFLKIITIRWVFHIALAGLNRPI